MFKSRRAHHTPSEFSSEDILLASVFDCGEYGDCNYTSRYSYDCKKSHIYRFFSGRSINSRLNDEFLECIQPLIPKEVPSAVIT